MKKVLIVGTLDTKGPEHLFIKEAIENEGLKTIVMDVGVKGYPTFMPDITSSTVAAAGGSDISCLIEHDDRGYAIDIMMQGATKIVTDLYNNNVIGGIISLGGSAGTTIATAAMRLLPVGFPKVMVSTVTSGDIRHYVGYKDIVMIHSVTDISGINIISSQIFNNAAMAVSGMMKAHKKHHESKPIVAATMFGVTTPCVTTARQLLELQGYEVLVFHANGSGGIAMERLIETGIINGVLDVTTTELCDEIIGGTCSAGPNRLEMAGRMGIPQVVSLGALDMVNFGPLHTVPAQFVSRKLYKHNASSTLMRTNERECVELGKVISHKLNCSQGLTSLYIPLRGLSLIDVFDKPFYGRKEDAALFWSIRKHIDKNNVQVIELDTDINHESFALTIAKKLISLIKIHHAMRLKSS
ncbi:Tm-1-like ATP-binding domain-containing protein [Paenibacillus ehimensis]|uniref:Tm-1-like ATP-binding domain-containing protein n=1 Tax=Paenibacillus ehimensis TaxID=79264 RepID=UPI002DBA14A4|nr:Tm-1-like ATP-binding domain-containing protein [Paenibacillus ehimensis]MEC0208623.1 Tm-1-like ATP-binding domain-containing protein [Paenibacillus ehimensis]